MTKKQFEQQLKEQAYTAVPDKREELLKTVAAQDAAVVSLSDSEDEPHLVPVVPAIQARRRWVALAACFAVVLVAVLLSVTAGDRNGELTKKEPEEAALTTTVGGAGDPFATVSNVTSDNQKGRDITTASGSVSGGTTATGTKKEATATSSVSGGTNVTQTASGSVSGGTNATGPVSSGTTQKGATTSEISKKTKNPFWGDFSVSTTKKKDSGATTEKTEAPSAKPTTKSKNKPTTKPTTAPTTRPTCSHEVFYRPPLPADVRNNSDKVNTCVKYLEGIEPTEPWEPVAPTAAPPTTKKQSTPSTYSEGGVEFKGCYPNSGGVYYVDYAIAGAMDVRYRVRTDVYFADGWRTLFISQCTENEILYTEVKKFADTGICVYEEKYNERSEIMTITCRDRNGNVISSATRNIPLKSWEFSEMYAY